MQSTNINKDSGPYRLPLDMDDLKQQIRYAGFTPSGACWEDERQIFAFSAETLGPSTFGHPKFSLQYLKDTRELLNENVPYVARSL